MDWITGRVVGKRVWAPGLFTLAVAAPQVEPFEPGQFLQLGLEQPNGHLHRPYSVASPHGDVLEFFVVVVDEGRLSPLLWRMEPGDSIDVSVRAAGSFTLQKCPDARTLWLIATGTGLAPYIAILRRPDVWRRYPHVILVHGVRHDSELAYHEEIAAYSEKHGSQFVFLPTISRQQVAGALFGRITTCLQEGSLETIAQAKIDEHACVMMCGNPDMLRDLEEQLCQRGLRRHTSRQPGHLVLERYW